MPAWCAARTLPESVASVTGQSFGAWELLIVDDASTDDTFACAEALAAADPRIRVMRHAVNRGAAEARNTALKAARGRYVACLDADDLWLPDKLTRQLAFMTQTGAALSCTGFHVQRGNRQQVVTVPERFDRAELLKGNVIGCLTAMWDAERLGHMRFPPIRRRQDYALWLAMLAEVPRAHGLNEPLAIHRRQPRSLSGGLWRRLTGTWSVYREVEGMGPLRSTWALMRHSLNRLRRGMRM